MSTTMTEQELLQKLLVKSATDQELRTGLLEEPRATLEKVTGRQLPPDFTIRFIEKAPEVSAMYVLPDPVPNEEELTPEELEAVAGGSCWTLSSISISIGG